jgi:hypothetical protein
MRHRHRCCTPCHNFTPSGHMYRPPDLLGCLFMVRGARLPMYAVCTFVCLNQRPASCVVCDPYLQKEAYHVSEGEGATFRCARSHACMLTSHGWVACNEVSWRGRCAVLRCVPASMCTAQPSMLKRRYGLVPGSLHASACTLHTPQAPLPPVPQAQQYTDGTACQAVQPWAFVLPTLAVCRKGHCVLVIELPAVLLGDCWWQGVLIKAKHCCGLA